MLPELMTEFPMSLTVNTGPLAGRQFNDLTELMSAQHEMQTACQHVHTEVRSGVSGRGLSKGEWSRVRCNDCGAIIGNNTYSPTPDVAEEKAWQRHLFASFRIAGDGEHPSGGHVLIGRHPEVGEMILFSTSTPNRHNAIQWMKEDMRVKNFPRGSRVVGIINI